MADEEAKVLSIGSIVGGNVPNALAWEAALNNLSIEVGEHRQGVSSDFRTNIVFQVPGQFLKPDFEGVRWGTFSKTRGLLMVQVAVPEELPDDMRLALIGMLTSALDEADRWIAAKRKPYDTRAQRLIVDSIRAAAPRP